MSVALFMAAVDQTIVATALPAIQYELDAPVNWSGWTITVYALGQVLMMPVAGRISEQFGRKKVFVSAAVLFTGASLACGFATDIYLLVVLRAIQAIGGGAFMPAATGIVADNFGHGRDRALGMFTSIFPIGGIVGPIVGGVFTAFWSWPGIFLVNVPIGLVLIALAVRFLPASQPRESGRVDFSGIALLGLLVITSMFGITYLGSGDTSLLSPVFLACEGIAVVALVCFVRHAKRHPAPFIPFELVRGRGFGVMNLINLCYGAAALGFGALVPLYAEDRFHIKSLEAGTLLTARAIGSICVAALAVLALRRTGHRLPMLVGFLITAVGLAAMYVVPRGLPPYLWLSIAAAVSGIGMGMSVPASNNASLQLAPEKVAAIAGLRGMFRQAGAIISISVATAVIARSSDAGLAQAHILLTFAGLMIAVLPLMLLVPDHRGSW
ncbi:MFS transporter [Amycolatopsis sp. NPDC051903]|uniref:MFS transporter n=1 Tax=Amycolatopsis sp. NPDC051903 TaxID=3363936 RepID=UPI0037B66AB6